MSKKGYKQTEEHKRKHLEKIRGSGNGRWKGIGRKLKAREKNPNFGLSRTKVARREERLKALYKLTLKDYEIMLVKQDNRCAICNRISESVLHVDHDHESGKIRGLLCGSCNRGLGSLGDSIELLEKAISYLKKIRPEL